MRTNSAKMSIDASDASKRGAELTLRGLLLGAAITLVFTAANVYLGLKVGLTFASSIPAAVISMGLLRFFKNATIYENNIVQTVASAAGTLSSIIFVLPGLVMVGWWTGFPFWETFGICVVGGVLGVLYTVPLRRALVNDSDLPYPEGVAAAEVLIVGSQRSGGVAANAAAGRRKRRGLARRRMGRHRLRRLCCGHRDASLHRRGRCLFPRRPSVDGHGCIALARAPRRGASRRPVGGSRDALRARHRVGNRDADPDRSASARR